MLHFYRLNSKNIVVDQNSGSVHNTDDLAFMLIGFFDKHKLYNDISLQGKVNAKGFIKENFKKSIKSKKNNPTATDNGTANNATNKSTITTSKEIEYAILPNCELMHISDEIFDLIAAGQLFSKTLFLDLPAEKRTTMRKIEISNKKENNSQVIKALCLHLSHSCNLSCNYCFAGRNLCEDSHMPFEVGKKALDFLIDNSAGKKNLEVDFFGGEPLLNFSVMKKLVQYARTKEEEFDKNFRFTVTTNGLLLNKEIAEYISKEMDNLVMSLDGRKEVHDRFRKTKSGAGSYDIAVRNFQNWLKFHNINKSDNAADDFRNINNSERSCSYYIRGTFTHHNLDFLNDIEDMLALGFKELSLEPIVGNLGSPEEITKADLPLIYREYEKLGAKIIDANKNNKPFGFYHFNLNLSHSPCLKKRLEGCGVGREYLAVTPEGDYYPCHQFVGDEKYLLGNVLTGLTNKTALSEFENATYSNPKECDNCWAKLFCGGGCRANAYHATGDINKIDEIQCLLFKKRLEVALYIQVSIS
ncbi:MAG: thioether cross-link-forming SCIFF peptide maturase [Anaerovoracaceae bacterium]